MSRSRPAGGITSIPLFYHSTSPVRCRLGKTNPISSGLGPAARKTSEEVGREPVLSLPKERPTHEEPDCAKQTQLPWSEWRGQVLGNEGVMMSWARKEPWQNKANFEQPDRDREARLRKTKPDLGSMGHLGTAHPGARLCKTNPIPSERPGMGRGRARLPRAKGAKRTQFRGAGRPVEYPSFHYSIIPPSQSDADCAKQSQSSARCRCHKGAQGPHAIALGATGCLFPSSTVASILDGHR